MAKDATDKQKKFNRKKMKALKNLKKQPGAVAVPLEVKQVDLSLERENRVFIFSQKDVAPKSSPVPPAETAYLANAKRQFVPGHSPRLF